MSVASKSVADLIGHGHRGVEASWVHHELQLHGAKVAALFPLSSSAPHDALSSRHFDPHFDLPF